MYFVFNSFWGILFRERFLHLNPRCFPCLVKSASTPIKVLWTLLVPVTIIIIIFRDCLLMMRVDLLLSPGILRSDSWMKMNGRSVALTAELADYEVKQLAKFSEKSDLICSTCWDNWFLLSVNHIINIPINAAEDVFQIICQEIGCGAWRTDRRCWRNDCNYRGQI